MESTDILGRNKEEKLSAQQRKSGGNTKFIVGGVLIIAAIVYLIVSSTQASSQYFLTVEELKAKGSEIVGREARISGVVIGDSIVYNSDTLDLRFEIAHIPGDTKEIEALGGMATVLHEASINTSLPRLEVIYNGVRPDLMKNEAQAIVTGKLGEDGVFYAEELLLKCPTKYEEAVPDQVNSSGDE